MSVEVDQNDVMDRLAGELYKLSAVSHVGITVSEDGTFVVALTCQPEGDPLVQGILDAFRQELGVKIELRLSGN